MATKENMTLRIEPAIKLDNPEDDLFYSESNVAHIKRGIKAFEEGNVMTYELLEDEYCRNKGAR